MNAHPVDQIQRRPLSERDRWSLIAFGALVAGFVAAQMAVWLPLSDSASGAVFVAVRATNAAVFGFWGARWVLRWRRTGADSISGMALSVPLQRYLRGCIATLFALLMLAAVFAGSLVSGSSPVLVGYGLFIAAAAGAATVVLVESVASARQMRADDESLQEMLCTLMGSNGETPPAETA